MNINSQRAEATFELATWLSNKEMLHAMSISTNSEDLRTEIIVTDGLQECDWKMFSNQPQPKLGASSKDAASLMGVH